MQRTTLHKRKIHHTHTRRSMSYSYIEGSMEEVGRKIRGEVTGREDEIKDNSWWYIRWGNWELVEVKGGGTRSLGCGRCMWYVHTLT